jgi:2-polyprenyl-3-methyl-5-hydroxy-6-metoxy-1,4-benzoquinol methylase
MTTLAPALTDEDAAQRDALAGRLFEATLGLMDIYAIHLGDRLGLYQALHTAGPATSGELAGRTGTQERYVREWLEQQAVTGVLTVEDSDREATQRRYYLPAGHAEVLLARDSLAYTAPLARMGWGIGAVLPALIQAFRTGAGLTYADYPIDVREGEAAMNRTMYINQLAAEWLPAVPDIHQRLKADPPVRVADVGCGAGWSSIALARAYPKTIIDGFDSDATAIAAARENAAESGVAFRVSFQAQDVADPTLTGRYDLVTAFECIHDMARPVEALRTMRRLLVEGGSVIVADERVAETFDAPGDEIERFMYGASVLYCLPTGMAEQPSAATGTVMRPDTLRRYAAEAGFATVEILPIEHGFWRFYRLRL